MSNHGAGSPKRQPAAEAPVYYECPDCGYLSADPTFGGGTEACPVCVSPGRARRSFPTDRLRRLDTRIRAYQHDSESEIVVILVAASLEAILEDILARILGARGADVTVRSVVLDGERSIGRRIGWLFPHLVGEEFEQAAAELGYADFPRRWRDMREARNAFIHDSPFRGPRETLDSEMARDAVRLLDEAYELFVLINNKFVADGHGHQTRH